MNILTGRYQANETVYVINRTGLKFPKQGRVIGYYDVEYTLLVCVEHEDIEFDPVDASYRVFPSRVLAFAALLDRCNEAIERSKEDLSRIDDLQEFLFERERKLEETISHKGDYDKPFEVGDFVVVAHAWSNTRHFYNPEKWLETIELHVIVNVKGKAIETHRVGGEPLKIKRWSAQERAGRFFRDLAEMFLEACCAVGQKTSEFEDRIERLEQIKASIESRIDRAIREDEHAV